MGVLAPAKERASERASERAAQRRGAARRTHDARPVVLQLQAALLVVELAPIDGVPAGAVAAHDVAACARMVFWRQQQGEGAPRQRRSPMGPRCTRRQQGFAAAARPRRRTLHDKALFDAEEAGAAVVQRLLALLAQPPLAGRQAAEVGARPAGGAVSVLWGEGGVCALIRPLPLPPPSPSSRTPSSTQAPQRPRSAAVSHLGHSSSLSCITSRPARSGAGLAQPTPPSRPAQAGSAAYDSSSSARSSASSSSGAEALRPYCRPGAVCGRRAGVGRGERRRQQFRRRATAAMAAARSRGG